MAAFVLICILGFTICSKETEIAKGLVDSFEEIVKEGGVMDEEGDVSLVRLFLNNLRATGMGTVLGVIPFLFLPSLSLISNGGIAGAVFAILANNEMNVFLWIAAGILPHGIFEIPAIVLGAAMGMMICLFECEKILGKGRLAELSALEFFGNICKLFVLVCVPLLMIAAVIETYVTPLIINMVL